MYPVSRQPAFRPASPQGPGDEHWQGGFGLTGTDGPVFEMTVAPNGDIYIGGRFTFAGSVPARNIARWDGTMWYALGVGVSAPVNALVFFGTDLYVGGDFWQAGGAPANHVAR